MSHNQVRVLLDDWEIYFEEKRNVILYEIENLQLKEVNQILIESQ